MKARTSGPPPPWLLGLAVTAGIVLAVLVLTTRAERGQGVAWWVLATAFGAIVLAGVAWEPFIRLVGRWRV